MFDDRRPFFSCILCGPNDRSGGTLTDEHIFGKKTAKDIGISGKWYHKRAGGGAPHRGRTEIFYYKAKFLCHRCNTKTLSPGMNQALPVLSGLIHGRMSKVRGEADTAILDRYWKRAAIMFDIISSNHEMTEEYKNSDLGQRVFAHRQAPPIITQEQRSNWLVREGDVPVTVFLARHDGVAGIEGFIYKQAFDSGRGADPIVDVQAKYFVIAIKHLVVILAIGGPTRGFHIPDCYTSLWVDTSFQLQSADYQDIWGIGNDEELQRKMRVIRIPALRALVESESRRRNSLWLPLGLEELYEIDPALYVNPQGQIVLRGSEAVARKFVLDGDQITGIR